MLSPRQCYYLEQMDIETWVSKPSLQPHGLPATEATRSQELLALSQRVAACTRCPLATTRSQTVFARGNPLAQWMVIGEAPGFYEDKAGQPFVGKAGKLLDLMLQSIGLTANDVYIANVIKCRPPDNRDPTADEIAQCADYLKAQIRLISPRLILGVGRFAGQFLIKKNLPLNRMREAQHDYEGIPVFVSYHPAYLLRNPRDKKKAYADLLSAKQWFDQRE